MTRQDGLTERVRSDICYLAKTHGVSKVILFGSRARGDYHRTSDIDLAVLGGDTVKFSLDVEEKSMDIASLRRRRPCASYAGGASWEYRERGDHHL